jgi:glycosyltransferase involved in cell wall biosynthesis
LRIAIYSLLKNSSWGGSENLWFKTAMLALAEQHDLLIIIHRDLFASEQTQQLSKAGAEIFVVEDFLTKTIHKVLNRAFAGFDEFYLFRKLGQTIDKFKPSLLVVNQPGGYDILYSKPLNFLLRKGSYKYCILTHSYSVYDHLSDIQIKKLSTIFNSASKLFFVAKKQAMYFHSYLKLQNANQQIVSNPLNIEKPVLLEYPIGNHKVKLAMVTTLFFASKGIDNLIGILAKDYWQEREWELEIYGSGPDRDALLSLIVQNDLSDRVRLMGFANCIEDVWKTNQILIMPSRVDAAPSVLLEAMACGRTAVCTDIGFCSEWIDDHINGFIAPSTTKDDFEKSLNEAFLNRHTWSKMGGMCYELVNTKHPKLPAKDFLTELVDVI